MSVPTFVVGTGRCGSTMLSNMLRDHPHILSLSEFFSLVSDLGGRIPEEFTEERWDGAAFWDFVGAITPRASTAVRHGAAMSEVLYPYDSPDAKYSRQTGVPVLLQVVLPHITDDHDALFEELSKEVITWPEASIGEHYEHLFGWLAQRFDKRMWIERSGGVFAVIEQINATFPEARYIHIVRDGRNTAISISGHLGYRMFILGAMLTEMLGVDPFRSDDRTNIEKVPPPMRAFLPENFDGPAFLDYRLPIPMCGGVWSQQITAGLKVLGDMPKDRLLTLRYEDFLADPSGPLDDLAAFLGEDYDDAEWKARCAKMVGSPRSSWRDLPADMAGELEAACQPGFEALRAAGIDYA